MTVEQLFTTNLGKSWWVVDTASELAGMTDLRAGDMVFVREAGTTIQQYGGATWSTKMGGATFGTYAQRPAFGRSGATYFATDVCGGTNYLDTGTAWVQVSTSAGVTLSAPTTFTGTTAGDVVLGSFGTIPANFLAVGSTFRLTVGLDSDILSSATARNLIFKVKAGATVLLTATVAVLVSVVNTNKGAVLDALISCTVTGATGILRTQANMIEPWGSAATDKAAAFTSAVAGVTVNTTLAQAITFTVAESVNTVADIVRSETGSFVLVKQ